MSKPFIPEPRAGHAPPDGARDLLRDHSPAFAATTHHAPGFDGAFDASRSYREIRARFESDFERAYVGWLLGRHEGNISAAAREARMDRKYLYDLARKHGLRGPRSSV